jgi:hypothetical protein
MSWPDGSVVAAIATGIIAMILGFDRTLAALGKIASRLNVARLRRWRVESARELIASYDERAALKELAMQAEVIKRIAEQGDALLSIVPQIERILAEMTPNGGGSMKDKVGLALEFAEHAHEVIGRLDAKMDDTIRRLDARIDGIDRRVTMME